ncbi:hypothetical protein [Winogradskyella wichelsiae]|uniref:hypothetical protein n=1 Tax=Winogradskyella wichelsiae TaxID=2697007 RepID=UPI0015C8C3BE|nr:hypothetical protein [Winogradskyella wichelsiae]
MFKKIIFTVSFILISIIGNAQKSINDYKYIIIPKAFEFSKGDDQYQLNSLTKFLFNKYGYDAYSIDDAPEDLKNNRCKGLFVHVSNEQSSMFKTSLEITLKDCFDNVVMTSKIGESRLKEYAKAYNLALRGAFESFQDLDYKYTGVENVTKTAEEEKSLSEEVVKAEVVSKAVENEEKVKGDIAATFSTNKTAENLFYAQAITRGFQLVNSEPKVVMILLITQAKDVFLVKDANAIVFNKDGQWVYSKNDGTITETKVLNIKF